MVNREFAYANGVPSWRVPRPFKLVYVASDGRLSRQATCPKNVDRSLVFEPRDRGAVSLGGLCGLGKSLQLKASVTVGGGPCPY
jgi:hypothetical protein